MLITWRQGPTVIAKMFLFLFSYCKPYDDSWLSEQCICILIKLFLTHRSFIPKNYAMLCRAVLSHFNHVWLLMTLWTVNCWAPLSMGFSRQQYWSGFPCPLPGDPPKSGIKPTAPEQQADSLSLSHRGSPTASKILRH